jgi:hypothetical protein
VIDGLDADLGKNARLCDSFIPPVIRSECHHSWKKSQELTKEVEAYRSGRSVNRGADTVAIVHDRNQPSTPMSMNLFVED